MFLVHASQPGARHRPRAISSVVEVRAPWVISYFQSQKIVCSRVMGVFYLPLADAGVDTILDEDSYIVVPPVLKR